MEYNSKTITCQGYFLLSIQLYLYLLISKHSLDPSCCDRKYMEHSKSGSTPPHVLIFPIPFQGHLIPTLKLAELFCLANLRVTFLNTPHNHQRLTQHSDVEAHFARYPGFRFEIIPDGLPDDHPRSGEGFVDELFKGLTSTKPFLKDIFLGSKITCLILDGLLSFAYDVASECEVAVIPFRIVSACAIWAYLCIPKLIEAGELPFKDDDMDKLVQNVPGMEGFLRCRDLPTVCRVKDTSDPHIQNLILGSQKMGQANSLIINTFEDLEAPIISHLRTYFPNIYSIGPLHAHLKHRQATSITLSKNSLGSLWEVDRSCISWLDQQAHKSVIYVSFGSLATLSRDQFFEIWAGLVQSKKHFLWVVRPNLITGNDDPNGSTPDELLEGTQERGCIVSWAPQEEVLAHKAIGGFLSQCGWNAALEGITAGVPMICWPYFYEQQLNSRYISEVWKTGLDMKDTCDRTIVMKMINDLMDGKRDELARAAAEMSQLANKSVAEGGSSYCNLEQLIEDIKLMSN